jgi:hypothetical protein
MTSTERLCRRLQRDRRRSVTFRITKSVLEDYPWLPFGSTSSGSMWELLSGGNPEAQLVMVLRGQAVALEEW